MARLLLIDDDIAEISAVKRVLSRLGHAPLLATSGSDALASTAQARPDLLIVGATCQGGEALRVVRFLDGDAATADIPLILLGTEPTAPERAVQLPRPVDPLVLTEHVKALLAGTPAPASVSPVASVPAPAIIATPTPAPVARPFERRTDPFELPEPMERRAAPSDPGKARRAAADALLARARQLRGGAEAPAAPEPARQAAAEAAAGLDALFELEPPAGVGSATQPIAETPFDLPDAPPLDLELEPRPAEARAPATRPDVARPAARQAAEERPAAGRAPRRRPAVPEPSLEPPVEITGSVHELAPPALDAGPASPSAGTIAAQEAARLREAELRAEAEIATARAVADAEARAHAALEQLQGQVAAEATRRAEAEAAVARLTEQASRLEREREALAASAAEATTAASQAQARASELERDALDRAAAAAEARREPPVRFDDLPPIDRAQEAARQRALSFRQPAEGATLPPAMAPPPAPALEAWPLPPSGPVPAELRGGHLEELPLPRLLAVALHAHVSGRLDVSGDFTRSLWIEDGRVVGAASNVAGERVDEVALRLGLLTREQHRQVAGAAAALPSRRAALLLVDRGYVKAAELTALVRARTEEVVFGLFGEASARYRWTADPVPSDERIALSRPPLALAVEGVRRRWQAARADEVLGGPATLLAPVADPPSPTELGLQPAELKAVALADGLRTLDEVLAGSPLDPLSTRQLLAALVLVGALSVRVLQAGRPAAQVSAGIDLARVKEKLEQVRRADYFTILGLGRVATPYEVREAAERLTAEFQAERFQGAFDEGLAGRLEEIRRVVADAREVLSDERLRAEYVLGLGR